MAGHFQVDETEFEDAEEEINTVVGFDLTTTTGRLQAVDYAFEKAGPVRMLVGKPLDALSTRAEIDAVLQVVNAMWISETDRNYARVEAVARSVRRVLDI